MSQSPRTRPSSELLRSDPPATHVSALMGAILDASASPRMAQQRRAWAAWQRANGDRERAHTVYVTTKESRAAADPVVVVGVDSHAFMSDLTANREIYLARLANVGFDASSLEVRLAPRERKKTRGEESAPSSEHPAVRAELTPEERAHVADMVSRLPDSIRPSASKALEKSILRKKLV